MYIQGLQLPFCRAVAWLSPAVLTSKYHVSTDSDQAILFYWRRVLFISMISACHQMKKLDESLQKR